MEYKGLPVYLVDINDNSMFYNVSIVDAPAIEEYFIKLAKETEIKFSVNEEKRVISGPVLIPGMPIYRRNGDKEFYIKFDEETIKAYAVKFFKDKREGEGNVQHQFGVPGITFFESYLINKDRNIAPVEFADLPNGTWILSAKVENDDVWSLIADGSLRGFSVDIQTTLSEDKKEIATVEELINYFKNK